MSHLRRHPDELLGAGLALIMTAEVVAADTARTPAVVALALLAGGALVLRRRAPLAGFVLALAGLTGIVVGAPGLDGESVAFIVIYFVAHYSLGRWTSGWQAWAGVALLLASMVAFGVGDAAQNDVPLSEVGLGSLAFTLGFVGGPWAAGLAIRLNRAREAALDAENRRLHLEQEESARRAVAAERARIARELHDVVSHAIAVTVLQARGARAVLGRDEEAVRQALDAVEQTNTAALSDMRRLLAVLRDTEEDSAGDTVGETAGDTGACGAADRGDGRAPLPSLAQLDRLVEQLRRAGLPVEVEVRGDLASVPPSVDLSAYRIVQEALTNVLKHAGPSTAALVTLSYADDVLEVTVADDGPAGAAAQGSGHGLIGIRERVAVVGGEVHAGPRPGGGFEVAARLPYSVGAP